MPKHIAVVEDESDMRELLNMHLSREGYIAHTYSSGDEFLDAVKSTRFDMVLLDLMLPGTDGLDICRILREKSETKNLPIIILTAKGSEADIVVGLELGADDYITKPFSVRELIARIKAVFRRSEVSRDEKHLKVAGIELFSDRFLVLVDKKPIELTSTEFKILEYLMRRKGWVLSRNKILEALGEDRQFVVDRTVDVHILNIRRKLGKYGNIIQTIRGVGYRMADQ